MHQLYPNAGLSTVMSGPLPQVGAGNWHLFTAIASPAGPGTVIGDMTDPPNTGYASVAPGVGTFVSGLSGNLFSAVAPQIAFTCSAGSSSVLGYYITDSTDTLLLGVAVFDAPQTFDSSNPVVVTPFVSLFSQYTS